MLPALWRWKAYLWVRSLTLREARRPLFKVCLLAWLLSIPAAWALIHQKASTPLPPPQVRLGLLRWGTLWMGAAQALLAALLWIKQKDQFRDAHLISHPASWRTLLGYRLIFSTAATSLLLTLGLFAAFYAGLLSGPAQTSWTALLLFAFSWTLQAFTLAVLVAALASLAPGKAARPLFAQTGLIAFSASVFLLTWGGDWLLHHHSLALRILGSPLADWSRWAWMPVQALEGWHNSDWRTLAETISVLCGSTFLSVIYLAQPPESEGRLLWPQAGGKKQPRSLSPSWLKGLKPATRLTLSNAVRLFAFKDLLVPLRRSRTRGMVSLLAPPLVIAAASALLDSGAFISGEAWTRASAIALAAWLAHPGLTIWNREGAMAELLKPWLPVRALFLAKASAFLLWSLLRALLSLLLVAMAGWLMGSSLSLPSLLLLISTVLLAANSFLIGWAFKVRPVSPGPLPRQSSSSLAGGLLYWATASALLLPTRLDLSLTLLAPAVALAAAMAWRHLSKTEGARI